MVAFFIACIASSPTADSMTLLMISCFIYSLRVFWPKHFASWPRSDVAGLLASFIRGLPVFFKG